MADLHPLVRSVEHPDTGRQRVASWRLIAGALLAPTGYSAQVLVSYIVAANGCKSGSAPHFWLVAVNLLALAAIVAGLVISVGNYRRTRGKRDGGHRQVQSTGDGRTPFLAYCGLCSSAIFALAVIVQLTSVILLGSCIGLSAQP